MPVRTLLDWGDISLNLKYDERTASFTFLHIYDRAMAHNQPVHKIVINIECALQESTNHNPYKKLSNTKAAGR